MKDNTWFADEALEFFEYTTTANSTLMISVVLFLFSDSLIAFKSTLLLCFGLYIMTFLKIIYQSPRPFWVDGDVQSYNSECKFDYASPSTHIFCLIFFW